MATMDPDEVKALGGVFGAVDVAQASDGRQLVRLERAALPRGCTPPETPVLLACSPNDPRPHVYVKPGIRLPDGTDPRSTSTISVDGEAWLQFSYNITWDPTRHTLVQLVQGALIRFRGNS